MLNTIAPFFIVDDLDATLAFYQSKLGFDVRYKGQPNRSRHEWARWDAYINTDDPDALYKEFTGRQVPMYRELANTGDGLRAFEIIDNNGYVLCFGRPVDK